MKRLKSILAALCLALAVAVPVTVLTTGCRTPTQQKFAVNSITSTHLAVDAALDTYLDLIIADQLSKHTIPTVMDSYATYQAAYRSALVIVLGDTNAPAPPALKDAAASFGATVTAAKKGSL